MVKKDGSIRSVTLISPAPPYFELLRNDKGPLTQLQCMPRLGLLALEAVTPPDWEVRIIDERIEPVVPEAIGSPIVGITTMTPMAPRAFALARQLKMYKKTVVLGGFFPSLTPKLALSEPSVDSIVVGRGEYSWPLLLTDFGRDRLQKVYRHAFGQDKFKLPQINYHLVGPESGYNGFLTQIQTSLGCKFNCRFCAVPRFYNGKYALRDVDDLVGEVVAAPSRRISFLDDNLLNSPAYLELLCDRLRPLKKKWTAQLSMDIRKHPLLLKKMRKSGCFWIHVGIESLDTATLKAQRKRQNDVRRYLETLNMIRGEGISVSSGFVFGFPTESPAVFENTEKFIDRAGLDAISFHYYTPFPGCPEYKKLEAADQLTTRRLEYYDTYHAVVRTQNYSHRELIENVEALKKRFYRPRRVLTRALGGLLEGYSGAVRTLACGAMGYFNCRQGLPIYP